MMENIEANWKDLLKRLSEKFQSDLDIQGVLFLIGVQELGQGYRKFSKDEKLDVIHIAICRLLSKWDYYKLEGADDQGWPHWTPTRKLPFLRPGEQLRLMKEAIIEYFDEEKMDLNG